MNNDHCWGDGKSDDKACDILIFSLTALHPVGGAHGYILYVVRYLDGEDTYPILIVPPPDWMKLNPLASQEEVAIAVFHCNDAARIGHPMVPYTPAQFSTN